MQIRKQGGHLHIIEASVEGRHYSLARKNHMPHARVRCRCTAGQSGALEDGVETGRNFLQGEIVVFVTMRATDFVQMLPFRLLGREGWVFAASCER